MKVKNIRKYGETRLSLRRSLLWIFGSAFCICSIGVLGLIYYFHIKSMRGKNEAYNIVAIVQSAKGPNSLQTVYFSELLGLSVNHPLNLYNFSSKEAQEKLNNSPIIKQSVIKKLKPGMLYIDYIMREPFAYLADYKNALVDREGVIFPFHPFYTPKKIPELFLGLNFEYDGINPKYDWGKKIDDQKFNLAIDLFKLITDLNFFKIVKLDVSQAFEPSYGQRQIILIGETNKQKVLDGVHYQLMFHWIVRLNSDDYKTSYEQANKLISYLEEQSLKTHVFSKEILNIDFGTKILDMRIPQLGFIKDE